MSANDWNTALVCELRERLGFEPVRPDVAHLDPAAISVSYNDESDTFYIHLQGRGHRALSVDVDRYLSLRVDLETQQIVGYMIEGFFDHAVQASPIYARIARLVFAGADDAVTQRRVDAAKLRHAVADGALGEIVNAFAA